MCVSGFVFWCVSLFIFWSVFDHSCFIRVVMACLFQLAQRTNTAMSIGPIQFHVIITLYCGLDQSTRSDPTRMGIANKRDSQLVKETIWHEEIQTLLLRVQSHANWRIGANTPPISFPYYERGKTNRFTQQQHKVPYVTPFQPPNVYYWG